MAGEGEEGELRQRLEGWLAHRMSSATALKVTELVRIAGGSSQETYRFHASWQQHGQSEEKDLILRRAPESGLVVAERDLEYTVYAALAGTGLPVPGAHFMELDPQWLDRPFFIMDCMAGEPGHFFAAADPYDGMGAVVARNFWHHLGTLAGLDHAALGLKGLRNGAGGGALWSAELSHWEAILDAGEAHVEPIPRGAIRWLRRNPPPVAAKPALVHGDYRNGNFLFVPGGSISAILDWEMCHIGDPLEDIAWAINPMWSMERFLPLDQALLIWEAASGLTVDRNALDWWRLFATVKACAIWTTAEASFENGTSREPIIALTAMRASHFHRMEMLERMAARGAMG